MKFIAKIKTKIYCKNKNKDLFSSENIVSLFVILFVILHCLFVLFIVYFVCLLLFFYVVFCCFLLCLHQENMMKLGFTGYTLFFLFLLKNIECRYSLEPHCRCGSNEYPQSMFWAEIWKYRNFLSENFHFLVVKFSVYLNRHVFVMLKLWPELQVQHFSGHS